MLWDDTACVEHRHKSSLYPTNMTDKEWSLLAPLLPPAKRSGRPRSTAMRAVVNAIILLTFAENIHYAPT